GWMRGVVLALICWSLAYPASVFFRQPELFSLLAWAALIPLMQGFISLGYPLLQKTLNFRRRVWVDLSKEAVFTLVAVAIALWWKADVMALLAGLLAGTFAAVMVSFMVHDYRPRFLFDQASARQILGFGIHLLGAGVLIFLMTNLDDAIVGRMLGMEQLGQYAIAFALAGLMTSQLVELLNGVLFPMLASVQKDSEHIKQIVASTLRLVAGVLTPIMVGVMLVAELPIRVALGEKWLMVAPVLVVLVMMGWLRGVGKVFGQAILALGASAQLHKMKWAEFALFVVFIVPLVSYWGIVGAALTLLLVYLLSLWLHIRVAGLLLGQMTPLLGDGFKGMLPAAVASVPALIARYLLPNGVMGQWVTLLVFVLFWLVIVYWKERFFVIAMWESRRR
ncbi:MAG: oligosaccharide flippase family protein, partial [Mariprofundales bacterium]